MCLLTGSSRTEGQSGRDCKFLLHLFFYTLFPLSTVIKKSGFDDNIQPYDMSSCSVSEQGFQGPRVRSHAVVLPVVTSYSYITVDI